ncbi:SWI/SNF complex component [Acrasis kona]|uniref:SWI/SNF complex component n=1 Tax=Acrasis kona TaxID=1008807 RepID=A0AAW2ZBV9_9EUKA
MNSYMGMTSSFVVNPQQPQNNLYPAANKRVTRAPSQLQPNVNPATIPISSIPPSFSTNTSHLIPPPKRIRRDDHVIPEEIQHLVPESSVLIELQHFEKRLDKIISDKKLRMRQALIDREVVRKTLHIQISCESNKNTQQDLQAEPEEWTMRIRGTIPEPNNLFALDESCKLTQYISSMLIDFEKEIFLDQKPVEWRRTVGFTDCEGFSFTKKLAPVTTSQSSSNVKIILYMRHDPPIYHMSEQLQSVVKVGITNSSQLLNIGDDKNHSLGVAVTLNHIITAVWNYIFTNKLTTEDRKVINCDALLKELFGSDKISFSDILQKLKEHLVAPAAIEIDYNMSADPNNILTIPVDIYIQQPVAQRSEVEVMLEDRPIKEVEEANENINKMVQHIREHKKKRDFMMAFSSDPVGFIHGLIHSQTRDLLIANNKKEVDEQRYSNYYKKDWSSEAVSRLFSQKM